MSDKYF